MRKLREVSEMSKIDLEKLDEMYQEHRKAANSPAKYGLKFGDYIHDNGPSRIFLSYMSRDFPALRDEIIELRKFQDDVISAYFETNDADDLASEIECMLIAKKLVNFNKQKE